MFGMKETLERILFHLEAGEGKISVGIGEEFIAHIKIALEENEKKSEEEKFCMILDWFYAPSGSPAVWEAAAKLRKKFPEIECWGWHKAFSNICRFRKR